MAKAKKKASAPKPAEPPPPKPINYLKLDAKFYAAVHKVKNGKSVPDDEWMIFLAQDNAFPATLRFYLEECKRLGADADHIESIQRTIRRLDFWRAANVARCKVPDATGEKLTRMMMLEVDMADVKRVAQSMHAAADQIPYACMIALNDATEVTRNFLIRHTWPTAIKSRNASFIAASLTTRDTRASKTNLSTEIYDKLDRGHLTEQAKGGIVTPRGRHIAVPVSGLKTLRTARGVPKGLRPRNMPKGIRIKDALYMRDKGGKLKLMYVLKPAIKIPRRVPFYEDYQMIMTRELNHALPRAIEKAMRTRR